MQTAAPANQRVRALVNRATEFKQKSDHCSGQSETWTELNLDKFAQMMVEECFSVIEQNWQGNEASSTGLDSLKRALRAHYGTR